MCVTAGQDKDTHQHLVLSIFLVFGVLVGVSCYFIWVLYAFPKYQLGWAIFICMLNAIVKYLFKSPFYLSVVY